MFFSLSLFFVNTKAWGRESALVVAVYIFNFGLFVNMVVQEMKNRANPANLTWGFCNIVHVHRPNLQVMARVWFTTDAKAQQLHNFALKPQFSLQPCTGAAQLVFIPMQTSQSIYSIQGITFTLSISALLPGCHTQITTALHLRCLRVLLDKLE